MLDILSNALARSVDLSDVVTPTAALATGEQLLQAAISAKPVLQLSELPITINPAQYANAFSSTNPNGTTLAARAFRDLVDPLLPFTRAYVPTASSTESVYGLIVRGASVTQPASFVQSVLASALANFTSAAMASLDGDPGNTWRLVEASPADWWNTSVPDRFQQVDLDFQASGSGAFTVLGGGGDLTISVDGVAAAAVSPATKLNKVSFKYQSVALHRSWCNPTLFNLGAWDLSGAPAGFCSSGQTETNDGVLPLLTSSILVGCDATIDADWAPADAQVLQQAAGRSVAIGPFQVGAAAGEAPALFLAAVISTLVPYSPQIG